MIRTFAAMAALALTGCTTQYVTRPVVLPTIAAPVLQPVPATAFTCPAGVLLPAGWLCVTANAYKVLVQRERQTWDWGAAQRAIIDVNNQHASKRN